MISHTRTGRIAALALVTLSLVASAAAQDNAWTGGASYWDLALNWSLGLPAGGQCLFIGYAPYGFSGATTFRSGPVSVASLFSRNALNVSGGSLSLTSTTESSTIDGALNLSGGTLGGGANLVVGGLATLTGGVLGGSGKTVANGGVAIASGTVRIADTRVLENRGAATWSGGTVNVDAGATFKNAAGSTFAANGTGFFGATWSGGNLVNDGTLTHATGTSTFSGVALSGTGSIQSTGGELRFVDAPSVGRLLAVKASGFGAVTFQGGTYDVSSSSLSTAGNGRIAFSNAAVLSESGTPWTVPSTSTAGSIRIQDSVLRVGFVVGSDRLGFYGANTLDGVTGDKGFRFGGYSTETIKNEFHPGGEIVLEYGARMTFVGDRTVDFAVRGAEGQYNPYSGIVMPGGARLTVGASGVLGGTGISVGANGASFDFRNEGALSASMGFSVDVAGGALTNAGLILANGGIAENGGSNLRVGTGVFLNSGTIRADAGSLSIQAANGAVFTNTGTIEAVDGGSVGVLWAPGTTESGSVRWSNAGLLRADGEGSRLFLGGTFRTADLGNLSVTNGARALVTGTLDNTNRTLTLSQPGEWALYRGGRILGGDLVGSSNLTLNDHYAASVLENVHLDGGLHFGEDGGWAKLLGTTHLNGLTTGSGRIDFTDDVTLDHDISGGISLGATRENLTITVARGTTYSGGVGVNVSYPQVFNVNVVNNGVLRGESGSRIEGTVTNHGLIEQTGGAELIYTRNDLINDGTIRATGGNVILGGSGKVLNSGTMTATNGASLTFQSFANGQALFNTGSIVASGVGSSLSFGMYSPFTLASLGDVRAIDGAFLSVSGNGQLDLQGGALTLGTGVQGNWRVEGGTIFNGNIVNSELLGLSNGFSQQRLRDVFVDRGLNVSGFGSVALQGSFRSGGTINASGIARIAFEGPKTIDYAVRFDGAEGEGGTIDFNGYGTGAPVRIAPTGELSGRNVSVRYGPGGSDFLNQGLIMAKGSGGKVEFDGHFQNAGTMLATQGGILRFGDYGRLVNASGTTLTGGTYRADANSRIQVYGLDVQENAATIVLDGAGSSLEDADGNDALRNLAKNSGSLSISGGRGLSLGHALLNSGTLGLGRGSTSSVGGDFAQTSTGRLNLDLGVDGTGLLSVAGNVSLGGALNVSLLDGYAAVAGSRFTFLTYTGALNGSLAVDPTRYSLVYAPGSVALQVNPVPEPASLLALAASGLALVRRRRR